MIPIRALYLPIHMHNFYNVRPVEEVIGVLEDQHAWGYNTLVLWYDVNQYNDPFTETPGNDVARAEWAKQKALAERAKRLGMSVWMISVANVIYVDQAAADPSMVAAPHPQSGHTPQHVCPSASKAREIILANHDRLFRELPGLSGFIDFAYDWGGCGCERCAPWASTYYDLLQEKASLLRRHVADASVYMCDWHFTDGEVDAIAARIGDERPEWLTGVVKDDRHPLDRWRSRGLPEQYETISFFDITMIGGWGTFGAQPFPERISRLCRDIRDTGIRGVIAYTEGIYDGANKALAGSLALDPDRDPESVLHEYARRYFGFGREDCRRLAEALMLCEQGFTMPMNPWWDQRFVPDRERTERMANIIHELDGRLRSNQRARGHWEWQSIIGRVDIERLLTTVGSIEGLHEAVLAEVRTIPEAARSDAVGAAIARAREALHDRWVALEQLRARIDDLRGSVYLEPSDKFPAMAVDESMFEGRWGCTYADYTAEHRGLAEQLRHLEGFTTVDEAHAAARRMIADHAHREAHLRAESERWGADGAPAPGAAPTPGADRLAQP